MVFTMKFFLLILAFSFSSTFYAKTLPLEKIKLPPGFSITVLTDNVPNARQMVLSDKGVLFVGTRRAGKVYAVVLNDTKTKANKVYLIAKDLLMPNGVAFRDGDLYVAAVNRIIRFDDIEDHLENPPIPVVVRSNFPSETHHGWKYIAFGPDDYLYVPVGAPCNVCLRKDKRFATIMRMHADGTDLQVYARGVRNTVGFTWHPTTKVMWFTDNGRDWLGDDLPPDELNYAKKAGMHFGFPYLYGNNVLDPKFGEQKPKRKYTPAALGLPAHVAALGLVFYDKKMFPEEYHHQLFFAEHGSWNRSIPNGYRISLVTFENGKPKEYKTFVSGWLQGNDYWGRPVDVLVMPDGALLISDDYAGVIYRIEYKN